MLALAPAAHASLREDATDSLGGSTRTAACLDQDPH
jgi:hypothetical protein